MGEVRAMSAQGGSEDLTDNFREVLLDRINVKLSELSSQALMDVLISLARLYAD